MARKFNHRRYTKRNLNSGKSKSYRRKTKNLYKVLFWILLGLVIVYVLFAMLENSFFTELRDKLTPNTIELSSYQVCIDKEFNSVICKSICGSDGKNYHSYKCVNGEAICKCLVE